MANVLYFCCFRFRFFFANITTSASTKLVVGCEPESFPNQQDKHVVATAVAATKNSSSKQLSSFPHPKPNKLASDKNNNEVPIQSVLIAVPPTCFRLTEKQVHHAMDLTGSSDRDNKTMLLQYLQLLNTQQQQQQQQQPGATSVSAPSLPQPQPPQPVIQQQQPAPSPLPSSNEAELFPFILYGLLDDAARTGQTHVVGWLPGGKSFCIRNVGEFATKFLPVYFPVLALSAVEKSGLPSHQTGVNNGTVTTTILVKTFVSRLVDDWGFGLEAGGSFFHPCFQSGNISLLKFMRCSSSSRNNNNRISTCDSSSTVSRINLSNSTTTATPVAAASAASNIPSGYSGIGNLAVSYFVCLMFWMMILAWQYEL